MSVNRMCVAPPPAEPSCAGEPYVARRQFIRYFYFIHYGILLRLVCHWYICETATCVILAITADTGRTAVTDDGWHRPLVHIRGRDLGADTAQTGGMTRFEAISGKTAGSENIWMGQTHVAPRTSSGDHHHGHVETAIYVLSGRPVFVFAEGDKEVHLRCEPGDYIFVPAHVPHREENPGDEEAVVVLARKSQEAVVVNLESLRSRQDPHSPA